MTLVGMRRRVLLGLMTNTRGRVTVGGLCVRVLTYEWRRVQCAEERSPVRMHI